MVEDLKCYFVEVCQRVVYHVPVHVVDLQMDEHIRLQHLSEAVTSVYLRLLRQSEKMLVICVHFDFTQAVLHYLGVQLDLCTGDSELDSSLWR